MQIGHGNSIDIDLFTKNEFKTSWVKEILNDKGLEFIPKFEFKNVLIGEIDGVKVDFIRHNYPFVKEPISEEGITYLSMADIAAMKVNVITDSGKRLKDFIDLYYLLEHFSFNQILEFYAKKYPMSNPIIASKAVNYFDDLDFELDPLKLKVELPLEKMKERINQAVLNSKKVFNE